jgi:hypothetical protein
MSADNAIYIREIDGQYRVKELHSFYYDTPPCMSDEEIDANFSSDFKTASTLEEAEDVADLMIMTIEENGGYVEYGTEIIKRHS